MSQCKLGGGMCCCVKEGPPPLIFLVTDVWMDLGTGGEAARLQGACPDGEPAATEGELGFAGREEKGFSWHFPGQQIEVCVAHPG